MQPADIKSLELIRPQGSGLDDFDIKKFLQKIEDLEEIPAEQYPHELVPFLHLFLCGKNEQLAQKLLSDPSMVSSQELKALALLNQIQLGKKIDFKDCFPFANNPESLPKFKAAKLAAALVKLYSMIAKNCESVIKTIDLFSLKEALRYIVFYYSQELIKENQSERFQKIEKELLAADFDPLEQQRCLAMLYRRTGDETKAETAILKYRELFVPDLERRSKLKSIGNKKFFSPEKTLENWQQVLDECDEIQNDIEIIAGLYKATCDYFSCSDCCEKTFPIMSYTEYLHLKKYLEVNDYDLQKIKKASDQIQADHEKQFGSKLKIIDKTKKENQKRGVENPNAYKYRCPFLDEGGRCSCYQARPLLCRGFGLSSDNNISIKTCNFYLGQYQHNSSPENERYVYDMRQAQMLARASDKNLTQKNLGTEKILSGTIVAWFSSDNEI